MQAFGDLQQASSAMEHRLDDNSQTPLTSSWFPAHCSSRPEVIGFQLVNPAGDDDIRMMRMVRKPAKLADSRRGYDLMTKG